jgi:hypothetical protein
MFHQLKQQLALLQFLIAIDDKQRKRIIQIMDNNQIRVISGIVFNMLHGNVSLSNDKITSLKRYKTMFRIISSKSTSNTEKKRLLIKLSKIIVIILPAVVRLITSKN